MDSAPASTTTLVLIFTLLFAVVVSGFFYATYSTGMMDPIIGKLTCVFLLAELTGWFGELGCLGRFGGEQ